MGYLRRSWTWLSKSKNQKTLTFIGVSLAAIVGAGWQVYEHLLKGTSEGTVYVKYVEGSALEEDYDRQIIELKKKIKDMRTTLGSVVEFRGTLEDINIKLRQVSKRQTELLGTLRISDRIARNSDVEVSTFKPIGVVTGHNSDTYMQFGHDIARIGKGAGLNIVIKGSDGSLENIKRLVSMENVALGFVKADVLSYLGRSTDPEMMRIANRLRLFFPLYREEVHIFARKDIRRFKDLHGKRVVVGKVGSGDKFMSALLFFTLDIEPHEQILESPAKGMALVLAGEADAMIHVGGKPVKLFSDLQRLENHPVYTHLLEKVHFVPLDHPKILRLYVPAQLGPDDYEWLDKKVPTVADKALLISYDFSYKNTDLFRKKCSALGQLANAIRENIGELRQTGHTKWREVNLDQDLGLWKRDTCSQSPVK